MNTETDIKPVSILDEIEAGLDITPPDSELAIGVSSVKTVPMVSSVEEMGRIFEDVVMRTKGPLRSDGSVDHARIAEMARTGTHLDPVTKKPRIGHRYRIEQGSLPAEGFIGHVPRNQFAYTVMRMTDKGNLSCYYGTLASIEQPSGRWAAVKVKVRPGVFTTRNGRVPPDKDELARDPDFPRPQIEGDEILEWIRGPYPKVVDVGAECLNYAIVWMDLDNKPDDAPLDASGKPTTTNVVNVNQSTDPAIAAVLNRLVDVVAAKPEAPAPAPVDTGLAALLADDSGKDKRIADLEFQVQKAQAEAKAAKTAAAEARKAVKGDKASE